MRNLILFFLFFSCFAESLFSQVPVFRHFSVREGLPSKETYGIYQDSKGYIWICTDAGIAKYNATSFKIFDSSVGLPDNTIFEVKEDRIGRIWFRSFSGQVGYIWNDSVFSIGAVPRIADFQNDGLLCSFTTDELGNLYLGRQGLDTICYLKIAPPYGIKDVQVIGRSDNLRPGLRILFVDSADYVFSENRKAGRQVPGYKPKKYYISIENLQGEQYRIEPLADTALMPLSRVFRSGSRLYVTNGRHVFRFDLEKKEDNLVLCDHQVISLYDDGEHGLLIGSVSGLNHHGAKGKVRSWISGHNISGIMRDETGGLWIASLNSGIFYTPAQGLISHITGKSLIAGISKTEEKKVLVGFQDGELSWLSLNADGSFDTLIDHRISGPAKSNFFDALPVSSNKLLLRNLNGYAMLDAGGKRIEQLNERSRSLIFKYFIRYRNGFLVSNYMDLAVMDSTLSEIVDRISFPDRVTSILAGKEGEVWVGGLRGLYRFMETGGNRKIERILDCRVESVNYSGDNLVVATKGNGVIIRSNGRQDTLDERSGLMSNICRQLSIYGDEVWVIGNSGISNIRLSGNGYSVVSYLLNRFEGVNSIEHVFMMDSTLFFSSGPGLYSYSLRKGTRRERFDKIHVSVNGRPVHPQKIGDLSYDRYVVRIMPEALFYSLTGRIEYRYKLRESDTTWNTASGTSIDLNELSPGRYQVSVQARNAEGEWVDAGSKIVFSIAQPFWTRWWFILLEIVASALVLALFIIARNRRKARLEEAKNRLHSRMQDLEIKALKAQMNPHFIFNALNSVQQFVLAGQSDNAYDSLAKFSKLIRKMLESNRQEGISLENEIDLLRKYIEVEALRFENTLNYEITVAPAFPVHNLVVPHMLIQPFVENAIWHGLAHKKSGRNLKVIFTRLDQHRVLCRVIDNGVGRAYNRNRPVQGGKTHSLGIAFIRERLELLASVHKVELGVNIIDLEDSSGEVAGTEIEVVLPLLNTVHAESDHH